MEIILLDDVSRVGHEGEVVSVADGYARNYLIPKGLAVPATRGATRDLERRRRAIEVRDDEKREKAVAFATELAGETILVKARAGEGQRLHGQVTPQMIAEAAREQLGVTIDRRDIDILEPIRELGDYLIGARVYKDVAAQLPVSVVRDAEAQDAAEAIDEAAHEGRPIGEAAYAADTIDEAAYAAELAALSMGAEVGADSAQDDVGGDAGSD